MFFGVSSSVTECFQSVTDYLQRVTELGHQKTWPSHFTGKSFAFPSWILIHNPWMESLKSTLGILMWFVVSTVIAYHIGIVDQNPMLGTRNFSLCFPG